ncbi:hypothetical protein EI94DRAFT_1706339 [Lactarius quietus]|nr:hypothetical protein EI94DRAFT_1706339 [Lactarius quietus]
MAGCHQWVGMGHVAGANGKWVAGANGNGKWLMHGVANAKGSGLWQRQMAVAHGRQWSINTSAMADQCQCNGGSSPVQWWVIAGAMVGRHQCNSTGQQMQKAVAYGKGKWQQHVADNGVSMLVQWQIIASAMAGHCQCNGGSLPVQWWVIASAMCISTQWQARRQVIASAKAQGGLSGKTHRVADGMKPDTCSRGVRMEKTRLAHGASLGP